MTVSQTEIPAPVGCAGRSVEDVDSLRQAFCYHVAMSQAKVPGYATDHDLCRSLCLMVRDRLINRWIATRRAYYANPDTKRVYYLSLEYLMGRALGNSLINLGLYDACAQALKELGHDLEELRDLEAEAGLGNGGLGRLAACFLDSMATLELPGYGYGLRYDFGMFQQQIRDGYQVEEPDDWLRLGNPWEIPRPEHTFRVQFYGRVERFTDDRGWDRFRWVETDDVLALPYDTPIPGYRNNTVNTLRLFSARPAREFNLDHFNYGDYVKAHEDRWRAANITTVLYPKDDFEQGQKLRLKQEYLLVSASLQDILARFRRQHDNFNKLPVCAAVQLNDTHPALAVPELMRLLIDREGLGWDEAWDITTRTLAYTNHTLMPEALEKWPLPLLEVLLPRHAQIIYEINRRFLDRVGARWPGDGARARRMSIIEEGGEKQVRMANLAIVGSHAVNGVSQLHTDILRERVFHDFEELEPDKLSAKTNGVTPRRWLQKCNQLLSRLITEAIGDAWVRDLERLEDLVPFADDAEFRSRWREVKRLNKVRLAAYAQWRQGRVLDPTTMFDCQIKRIHDYKRQLLKLLHVIALYNRIKAGRRDDVLPRTVVIAGKAAPGYLHAKLTIKLTNAIADVINHDPDVAGRIRLEFLANYGVGLAEHIIPATNLSEQISTAGMEASGTGNMKFALNGAITIGTLDGANIEIMDHVGEENIFIFGLTADEIGLKRAGNYDPWMYYHTQPELRQAIDQITHDFFTPHEPGLFRPLMHRLFEERDPYMVMADFAAYIDAQDKVERAYRDGDAWARMSILNTARLGYFSSDRTISEYAEEIWRVPPVPVTL